MSLCFISSNISLQIISSLNTKRSHQERIEDQEIEKETKKSADQFKISITKFVNDCEKYKIKEIKIKKICDQYGFQRRRFYDVLNVLESVGCCTKLNTDVVLWQGLSNIPYSLEILQHTHKVDLVSSTLEDIFTDQQNIKISNLTEMLMLCFLVMRVYTLDIKHVAIFLSRYNNRYKTTLCKLYQVTHILESAGIISKTFVPCVFTLNKEFVRFVDIRIQDEENPLSLVNLLNDHSSTGSLAIEERRVHFFLGYKKIESRPYHYRTKIPYLIV
ncbi:hypothetical protein M9Y10_025035 [Tritrichomonas musculus]|uniref:E2F/DP family winged-helix DNA-binding domain-containing protein n=1 Tax=Tritrichomonas musculus TaxID=1915356 RepID=A0ABR2HBE5_9EUKA